MDYQPLIPTGTVQLDQDYLNIQGNFQAADTAFGVDHTLFSVSLQSGYHKSIHMIPQPDTVNVPGFPQLFSRLITDVNTDEALYYNTGTGNRTVQMTVPIVPVVAAAGYTFLPGGLILQWGFIPLTAAGGFKTVTYPMAFPVTVLSITMSSQGAPGSSIGGYSITGSNAATDFTIRNSSGTSQTFNYMAIGY